MAIVVAQSGGFDVAGSVDVASMFVEALAMLFLMRLFDAFDVFRIGDGTGDHVTSTRPLAEVDQPAPIAAEREVRLIAQHELAARWTTQADDLFLRHDSIVSVG